jgi:TolB protein
MNRSKLFRAVTVFSLLALAALRAPAQQEITIEQSIEVLGFAKPVPVHVSGFTGEVDAVLKNDLTFMGLAPVAADQAKYLVSGSNAGRVEGQVIEKFNKAVTMPRKAYAGGSPRAQTHALADDVAQAITGRPGIAQTKIAFKVETGGGNGEIYIADYDGFNAQPATQDRTLVAAPCWLGKTALYYASYKLGPCHIYSHNLRTGERRAVTRASGSNMSPAVSPDGRRLAMILSKSGSPDLYVSDLDGTNLKQLTATREAESSPCWSPDGQTVCFVSRERGAASLYTVPAGGGAMQRLRTAGVPNATEPDWSPDGKWIVFTTQMRDFQICLVKAEGGEAHVLVPGEDPSWAPNSRAVIFCKGPDHAKTLSLLDVPTKHVKSLARISESNSQPSWAK